MYVRFVLIAAAVLCSSNAYAADPAKPEPQPSAQAQHGSPQVVLASAAQVQAPAPAGQQAQPAATPPKKRVGRATSCRCAGQLPQSDPGE